MKFEGFSIRNKLIDVNDAIQIDRMNNALKNAIWSYIYTEKIYLQNGFFECMYTYWLKEPIDEIPEYDFDKQTKFKTLYQSFLWNEVYDLIEFIYFYHYRRQSDEMIFYTKGINRVLERENSGYRLINGRIVPISNPIEIDTIQESLDKPPFAEIKKHIETSLLYLSDREHPQYRNSIKESISAVETLCRKITKESTLGNAIKKLENKGIMIPPVLKQSMSKMYDFTNGPEGIRHALMEEVMELELEEAKYMLVTCSAFINYVVTKLVKIHSVDKL